MPLYTFVCSCGVTEEHLVSLNERDTEQHFCPECGMLMTRAMDTPIIGKPAHQMHAIADDGRKIPGHFGKEAKRK